MDTHYTYDEIAFGDCEPIAITFDRAIQECHKHGIRALEMVDEIGNAPTYDATTLLVWLGY